MLRRRGGASVRQDHGSGGQPELCRAGRADAAPCGGHWRAPDCCELPRGRLADRARRLPALPRASARQGRQVRHREGAAARLPDLLGLANALGVRRFIFGHLHQFSGPPRLAHPFGGGLRRLGSLWLGLCGSGRRRRAKVSLPGRPGQPPSCVRPRAVALLPPPQLLRRGAAVDRRLRGRGAGLSCRSRRLVDGRLSSLHARGVNALHGNPASRGAERGSMVRWRRGAGAVRGLL
mmetsp:Transcript_14148/g.45440  ORF Transcript_14148/g.45440 Transcript_14148/m.45440 type:complete len:235 (-) Transcript_14148:184-888(-)